MKVRFINFKHAFSGIIQFFRREFHAWIHLISACSAISLGAILKLSEIEWILLSLTIGLVFLAEILNTALERLCDIVMPDFDARIKEVKDLSAAAVLFSSLVAVTTGLFIFLPKIIAI